MCQACQGVNVYGTVFPVCLECQSGFFLLENPMKQDQQVFPSKESVNVCVSDCNEFSMSHFNNYGTKKCESCGPLCAYCRNQNGCQFCIGNQSYQIGMTVDYNASTDLYKCIECEDPRAQTCEYLDYTVSKTCFDNIHYSVDNGVCKNSNTCNNQYGLLNCLECSSSTTCTACDIGYYLESGECFHCQENCEVCSSASSCDVCLEGFFYDTTTNTCSSCRKDKSYSFECSNCSGLDQVGVGICEGCDGRFMQTYDKITFSSLTEYTKEEVKECFSKCLPYHNPTGSFYFQAQGRVNTSKCDSLQAELQGKGNCYDTLGKFRAPNGSELILCATCEKGKYLDTTGQFFVCASKDSSVTPEFKIYVSPDDQNDSINKGGRTDPFGSLYNAYVRALELSAPYQEATVYIYLQKGDHYMLRESFVTQKQDYEDWTSLGQNFILMPEPCDGSNADTCSDDKITIYNKIGSDLKFPIFRSLKFENLIIDSIDSVFSLENDPNNCLKTKKVCCTPTTEFDGIESKDGNGFCDDGFFVKPTENCQYPVGSSMFVFMSHSQNVLTEPQKLEILNSEFKNFNFEFNSLIEMSLSGAKVLIEDSIFDTFNTCGSIIRNFKLRENIFDRSSGNPDFDQYIEKTYYPAFDILKRQFSEETPEQFCASNQDPEFMVKNGIDPCFQVVIGRSTFKNFGLMKDVIDEEPIVVDKTWGLTDFGMVLSLKDFKGNVFIERNTFQNNHINYSHCQLIDLIFSKAEEDDSKMIQIKSLISLINYQFALNVQGNTFQQNSSLRGIIDVEKGKNILAYSYFQENRFIQNTSLMQASVIFMRMRSKTTNFNIENFSFEGYYPTDVQSILADSFDYSTFDLSCGGVGILFNTFEENSSCPLQGGGVYKIECILWDSEDESQNEILMETFWGTMEVEEAESIFYSSNYFAAFQFQYNQYLEDPGPESEDTNYNVDRYISAYGYYTGLQEDQANKFMVVSAFNSYTRNSLSNEQGLINFVGCPIVQAYVETMVENVVSFQESFQVLQSYPIRPFQDASHDTLKFAKIMDNAGQQKKVEPVIIEQYVDPKGLFHFTMFGTILVHSLDIRNNVRFEDRPDYKINNPWFLTVGSFFGDMVMYNLFSFQLATVNAEFFKTTFLQTDSDRALSEVFGNRSVTNLVGKTFPGSTIRAIVFYISNFSNMEFTQAKYTNQKSLIMDIAYDPKALVPSCVNFQVSDLKVSNLDFYGNDISLFTITCIGVSIENISVSNVNQKVKELGFYPGSVIKSFNTNLAYLNLFGVYFNTDIIMKGLTVDRVFGGKGAFLSVYEGQIITNACKDESLWNLNTEDWEDFARDSCYNDAIKIHDSSFSNCHAFEGGVFYFDIEDSRVLLQNLKSDSNYSQENGGFVFVNDLERLTIQGLTATGIEPSTEFEGNPLLHSSQSDDPSIFVKDSHIKCQEQFHWAPVKLANKKKDLTFSSNAAKLQHFALFGLTKVKYFEMSGTTVENCYSGRNGVIIQGTQTIIKEFKNTFKNNAANIGVFYCALCFSFTSQKSKFIENFAHEGGVFYVDTATILTIEEGTFLGNGAFQQSGVIHAANSASVFIKDSVFKKNWSEGASSVLTLLGCLPSEIVKCVFEHNMSNQSTIKILETDLTMKQSIFNNNTSVLQTNNIFLGFTTTTIEDTYFGQYEEKSIEAQTEKASESLIEGSFLFITINSQVNLKKIQFHNGIAAKGGAVYVSGGKVNLEGAEFIRNVAKLGGAGLYFNSFQSVELKDLEFKNNYASGVAGDDIYAIGTANPISVSKAKFIGNLYTSNSVYLSSVDFQGSDLLFKDLNKGYSQIGAGIQCQNCNAFKVENSVFHNLTSEQAPAIYLQETEQSKLEVNQELKNPKYEIRNSNFTHNLGNKGGSIYVDNSEYLRIQDCYFQGNQATIDDRVSSSGNGGALYFFCNTEFGNCQLDLQNNVFIENTAQLEGGAVKWNMIEPYNIDEQEYEDNYAGFYGNDVASHSLKMVSIDDETYQKAREKFESGQEKLDSIDPDFTGLLGGQGRLLQQKTAASIDEQKSGGVIDPFYMALVDTNDDIVGTITGSKLNVQVKATSGETYPPNLSGVTQFTSENGIFKVEGLQFTAEPGQSYQLTFSTDGIDPRLPKTQEYLEELQNDQVTYDLEIKLRECKEGEAFLESGRCDECKAPDFYSLEALSGPQNCKICPENQAICLGGNRIGPKKHYWRSSEASENFIECLNERACLGFKEPEWNPKGQCEEGFQGQICTDCQVGYSRTGSFDCSKCPNEVLNVFRILAIITLLSFLIVIMIKSTLASAKQLKNVQSVYYKILMNHLQLIMLTASFNLNWPDLVLAFFESSQPAAEVTNQAFSFDCFIDTRAYGEEEDQNSRIFFLKLGLLSFLPVLITMGTWTFWKAYSTYKKQKRIFQSRFSSTIIILLFLVHPTIVTYMFDVFNCTDIDGTDRILNDLEVECWKGAHFLWGYFVALPSIFVWGLGIPFFAYLILNREKENLQRQQIRERLGFLFNGYKIKYYYWEIIIMYRKIAIIFISIFLRVLGTMTQALVVFLLLIGFLAITGKIMPFNTQSLNDMELLSLLTSMLTIYCGLYFLSDISSTQESATRANSLELNQDSKIFFFLIILFSNTFFFIYWLAMMTKELQNTFRKKASGAYLWLCLCGNRNKLIRQLEEQEKLDKNEVYYEKYMEIIGGFRETYKSGRITLNENMMEKISFYCDQERFLEEIGVKNQERKKLEKTDKQVKLEKRQKEFQENVVLDEKQRKEHEQQEELIHQPSKIPLSDFQILEQNQQHLPFQRRKLIKENTLSQDFSLQGIMEEEEKDEGKIDFNATKAHIDQQTDVADDQKEFSEDNEAMSMNSRKKKAYQSLTVKKIKSKFKKKITHSDSYKESFENIEKVHLERVQKHLELQKEQKRKERERQIALRESFITSELDNSSRPLNASVNTSNKDLLKKSATEFVQKSFVGESIVEEVKEEVREEDIFSIKEVESVDMPVSPGD